MAGEGSDVLCDLHNHIGSNLKYVTYHDWWGHISDPKYPETIENNADQPGKFKHVADERGKPKAAVVYESVEGNPFYWVICWEVAGGVDNRVYTEIKWGSFNAGDVNWNHYKHKLEERKSNTMDASDDPNGTFKATVTIDISGNTPGLSATIVRN